MLNVYATSRKEISRSLGIRSALQETLATRQFLVEKSKAKVNDEQEEESDENDEPTSQIPTSTFQQWIDGSPMVVNKSLYPTISCWLALTTPNGAPANPITVHRKLLKHMHGVSVTAKQVKHYVFTYVFFL